MKSFQTSLADHKNTTEILVDCTDLSPSLRSVFTANHLSINTIEMLFINDFEVFTLTPLTPREKLIAKIELLRAIQHCLEKKFLANPVRASTTRLLSSSLPIEQPSRWRKLLGWFKQNVLWLGFIVLMIFNFTPMIIGGLMYTSHSLAALIPYFSFLPNTVFTVLGIGCAVSWQVGTICFVGPILMKWLGIQSQSLLTLYQEQLETAQIINDLLLLENDFSHKDYHAYIQLAAAIKINIKQFAPPYPKASSIQKIAFQVLMGLMKVFTAIQSLSVSLYFSATMISAWSGTVLTAAAGTAITTFVASMPGVIFLMAIPFLLAQYTVSYRLNVRSTDDLLDPAATNQKTILKTKLESYICLNHQKKMESINRKKLSTEHSHQLSSLSHVIREAKKRLCEEITQQEYGCFKEEKVGTRKSLWKKNIETRQNESPTLKEAKTDYAKKIYNASQLIQKHAAERTGSTNTPNCFRNHMT
jgi:hypothetical protein